MTHPSINSPTAPVSGGLREQGNTKGSLSEVSKRSGNFANGAGCLSGSTAPRQHQEAALGGLPLGIIAQVLSPDGDLAFVPPATLAAFLRDPDARELRVLVR